MDGVYICVGGVCGGVLDGVQGSVVDSGNGGELVDGWITRM